MPAPTNERQAQAAHDNTYYNVPTSSQLSQMTSEDQLAVLEFLAGLLPYYSNPPRLPAGTDYGPHNAALTRYPPFSYLTNPNVQGRWPQPEEQQTVDPALICPDFSHPEDVFLLGRGLNFEDFIDFSADTHWLVNNEPAIDPVQAYPYPNPPIASASLADEFANLSNTSANAVSSANESGSLNNALVNAPANYVDEPYDLGSPLSDVPDSISVHSPNSFTEDVKPLLQAGSSSKSKSRPQRREDTVTPHPSLNRVRAQATSSRQASGSSSQPVSGRVRAQATSSRQPSGSSSHLTSGRVRAQDASSMQASGSSSRPFTVPSVTLSSTKAQGKRRAVDDLPEAPNRKSKKQRRSSSCPEDDEVSSDGEYIPPGHGTVHKKTKKTSSSSSLPSKVKTGGGYCLYLNCETPTTRFHSWRERNRHMESHSSIGRYICPNPGCPTQPRPLFARTDSILRHCGYKPKDTKTSEEDSQSSGEGSKSSKTKSLECRPFLMSRRKSEYCIHPVPYYLSCDLHKLRKPAPNDPLYSKYLKLFANPPEPCGPCRERFKLEELRGLNKCESKVDRRRVNYRK